MKATNLLILFCIAASFIFWYRYTNVVDEYLVYTGNKLKQGFWWTTATTLFIHSDIIHLVGNMIFLYVFGNVVEKETDGKTTALTFFAGGIGSLLISSFYYGFNIALIGASGAIFTLAAVTMLTKPLKQSLFFLFIPLGLVAILYFIYNVFAVGLGLTGQIGYVAHVAGFIVGIPFGIAFSKGQWVKNLGITALLLAAFVILILLFQTIKPFFFQLDFSGFYNSLVHYFL